MLDPFVGTGTTSPAVAVCGRRSIGIEVDPEYFAKSVDRVRVAVGSGAQASLDILVGYLALRVRASTDCQGLTAVLEVHGVWDEPVAAPREAPRLHDRDEPGVLCPVGSVGVGRGVEVDGGAP